ncbi:S-locus receptor kinase [Dorcoceras hygrometricum]|uniref:S-locus receptor kinase n=1 Tax=Dorcoceras hygrometricum TaxID=472368 RepID=A0A2Z7CUT2_9LAMI|nr:S-locus receptor kinase [Dorcoceras hygrometricum]
MHISRNCVTNYIHKFNVIVLGRDLFVKWVLIHSLNNLAQLTKCASESVCDILQSACWSFLEEVPAGFIIARPSAESLARRQNAVISTYANDIVLQSPTSNTNCWLNCDWILLVRRRSISCWFNLASA